MAGSLVQCRVPVLCSCSCVSLMCLLVRWFVSVYEMLQQHLAFSAASFCAAAFSAAAFHAAAFSAAVQSARMTVSPAGLYLTLTPDRSSTVPTKLSQPRRLSSFSATNWLMLSGKLSKL